MPMAASEIEARRAAADVVRIGGDELHEPCVQQADGELAGGAPEIAEQAASRDLHATAFFHPLADEVEALPEEGVAFGMREDDAETGILEPLPEGASVGEDGQLGQFHEQPAAAVDGEIGRKNEGPFHVSKGEVKSAAPYKAKA